MNTERNHNPMLWSTIVIALLVALTAAAGIFWPATYARETLYHEGRRNWERFCGPVLGCADPAD
jgi:hypothetical protein